MLKQYFFSLFRMVPKTLHSWMRVKRNDKKLQNLNHEIILNRHWIICSVAKNQRLI